LAVIPPEYRLLYKVDETVLTDEKCYLYIRDGGGVRSGSESHDSALQ
jgi:hypothetical protein